MLIENNGLPRIIQHYEGSVQKNQLKLGYLVEHIEVSDNPLMAELKKSVEIWSRAISIKQIKDCIEIIIKNPTAADVDYDGLKGYLANMETTFGDQTKRIDILNKEFIALYDKALKSIE